jgi:F-type H+-transporting ATPase subunit a
MLYGAIDDMVNANMGSGAKAFVPYFIALFAFLLVSNISSFIGLGVVRAPTADIATPAALAILTFILTQVNKIKVTGVKAYFKSFIEPIPIMLPMNIISEIANPVSLTFRLFGNMMGGMMLGALIYAMLVGSNLIPIWISVAAIVLTVLLLTKQYKKLKTLEKGKKALVMGLAIICMLPLFPMAIVHGYFDVFAGCLQAYIFCMLSMLFIAA